MLGEMPPRALELANARTRMCKSAMGFGVLGVGLGRYSEKAEWLRVLSSIAVATNRKFVMLLSSQVLAP